MRSLVLAGLFIAAAIGRTAQADGLIYQLPADGAQVRYDMEIDLTPGGQDVKVKGSVTISSVGQTTENGETCRWIEFKMINPEEGQDRIAIYKVLIPEKHLGKGQSAAENVIRAWIKEGDGEPQEHKDLKAPQAIAVRAFLAGPGKNPGELEKKEIDGKLGKLDCAGVTGEQEFDVDFGMLTINVVNRLHEKAPFGLVNAAWKFELKNMGQVVLGGKYTLTLTDTNTTALTELPDRK